MINIIAGSVVVIGLIIGIGIKLYFGDNVYVKTAEEVIEMAVKEESGFDIEPIIDLDDKPQA